MLVVKMRVTMTKINDDWRARYIDTYFDDMDPRAAIKGLEAKVTRWMGIRAEAEHVTWNDPEPEPQNVAPTWRERLGMIGG